VKKSFSVSTKQHKWFQAVQHAATEDNT